jgi:hypothetical protein
MMFESPAVKTAEDRAEIRAKLLDLKVRRYVTSDIPKILDLIGEPKDTIKFILENNVRNNLVFCDVLVDINEIVGFMVSKVVSSGGDLIATSIAFYIAPEFRVPEYVNELVTEYETWARERRARYAEFNDQQMEGAPINLPFFRTFRVELS